MGTKINKPHDSILKEHLVNKEVARYFVVAHLEPELLELCDLNTLTIENTEFIDCFLTKTHA